MVKVYWKVKRLVPFAKTYIVIPDYPDDYHPRNLWINDYITNIERTIENVLIYTRRYRNIRWIIPIQGHWAKPDTVLKSLEIYDDYGILDSYKYFGIGVLCIQRDTGIILETTKIVREYLGDKKLIHIFGIKMKALPYIKHLIDSFDSMAWTIRKYHRIYKDSFRNKREEQEYLFKLWLQRLEEVIGHNMTYK